MRALSSKKLFVGLATSAVFAVAIGCSGEPIDTPTSGTAGSGGSGASGGSGGEGGATGGAGGTTGGAGGEGGSAIPDAGGVTCNGVVCPTTMLSPTTSIPACCTTQNACGLLVSLGGMPQCIGTSFPEGGAGGFDVGGGGGVADPSCAGLTWGRTTFAGCCMADNLCGFSMPLGGCISHARLAEQNFPGVNLPEGGPMACMYPPPGG
jgi:hypothetical protein